MYDLCFIKIIEEWMANKIKLKISMLFNQILDIL